MTRTNRERYRLQEIESLMNKYKRANRDKKGPSKTRVMNVNHLWRSVKPIRTSTTTISNSTRGTKAKSWSTRSWRRENLKDRRKKKRGRASSSRTILISRRSWSRKMTPVMLVRAINPKWHTRSKKSWLEKRNRVPKKWTSTPTLKSKIETQPTSTPSWPNRTLSLTMRIIESKNRTRVTPSISRCTTSIRRLWKSALPRSTSWLIRNPLQISWTILRKAIIRRRGEISP